MNKGGVMAKPKNFASDSFGFIGMLLPLLYFGGLLYYFSGVGGGTLQGIIDIGLGPTMLGLGVLGLLFAIKPLYILFRFVIGLITGAGVTPRPASSASTTDDASSDGFDAEDAIARYLRNRDAGKVDTPIPAEPAPPPMRPSFGRKPG
jgi:hypothetical protein